MGTSALAVFVFWLFKFAIPYANANGFLPEITETQVQSNVQETKQEMKANTNSAIAVNKISISTSPQGASIYSGDKYYGKSPVSLKDLTHGKYSFVAELPGYERHEWNIDYNGGERNLTKNLVLNVEEQRRKREAEEQARIVEEQKAAQKRIQDSTVRKAKEEQDEKAQKWAVMWTTNDAPRDIKRLTFKLSNGVKFEIAAGDVWDESNVKKIHKDLKPKGITMDDAGFDIYVYQELGNGIKSPLVTIRINPFNNKVKRITRSAKLNEGLFRFLETE
jgi:hypothetical protein